jgi:hypothetical protein
MKVMSPMLQALAMTGPEVKGQTSSKPGRRQSREQVLQSSPRPGSQIPLPQASNETGAGEAQSRQPVPLSN